MLRARALLIIPLALLLAIVAVRAMTFEAPLDHPLRRFQPLFSGHPDALVANAMHDIGAAAATGAAMPPAAHRAMLIAATKAPLAIEPFLVDGTIAEIAGNDSAAERLFLAARLRNPRAPAPRYFLADRYLHTNRIAAGLGEMAALARMSDKASQPMAPALAAYARSPGAIGQLRQFFVTAPAMRDVTLDILAKDPANAGLVMALAPPLPAHQVPPPAWQASLLQSLVNVGNYRLAADIWSKINGVANRGLLYDPQFRNRSAAPPFAWKLQSGSAGVAEASGAGGLDVIFYGREETVLATQLVQLAPGTYRLAMRVEAPVSARGLAWTISCLGEPRRQLFQLALDAAQSGVLAGTFAVPASGCAVQWVELHGHLMEASDTAQVTISDLRLDRVTGR